MSSPAGTDRASLMIDLGRYADAARLLSAVVGSSPEDARAWCLLARAHLGAGADSAAVQAAARASALDPGDDWPYRLASTALVGLGQLAEAVAAAIEACRLAPHLWRSHVCLAQAADAGGRLELARSAAADALAIAPGEADVHVTAGRVALSSGDLVQARQRQATALAIEPGHSGALNELGRILLQARDPGAAAGHFIGAARAAPASGIFAANADLALARLARRIGVACAVLAAVVVLALTGRMLLAGGLAALLVALAVRAWRPLRRLPPAGRRRVARLISAPLGGLRHKAFKAGT